LLLPRPEDLADELPAVVKLRGPEICLRCRFTRLLCGRPRCPILVKLSSYSATYPKVDRELSAASPPSVFVGRYGYPKVALGPLMPPTQGDTTLYDEPELWHDLSFDDIVKLRVSMVRGKKEVHVEEAKDPSGILYELQCMLLSSTSVDTEVRFVKKPQPSGYLDDTSPPFGPSAGLERYRFLPGRTDGRLERVYYDKDLNASKAVVKLYNSGVSVNVIQRLFSTGMIGVERRLVPTRWSITAVDDTISKYLLSQVKAYQSIDLYHVLVHEMLGSKYLILMAPGRFSYEWVEAWFPKTLWNPANSEPTAIADHEGYLGRTTYAEPGGCYYSVRLAVSEYLTKLRRQATVVAFREIYPGQILPLGVWNVREAVRIALNSQPAVFDSLKEALNYSFSKLALGRPFWLANSYLLKDIISQTRLDRFV
jgi:hypothetical protein